MEKFIVSARKYRPQTFDTVVGQEHITTTLKNAIKNEQLAHAFLFCGPRGVGKTTCARILAKTINCQNLQPDGEACNECTSCVSFNSGASLNIHELDAASNNSVDDIRALVEQVRYAPSGGRYKVYIIDEVHMLSAAAFNAFLKTLEEPPPYAIFILATTEKHKILPTILSRCQIFDFKRITINDTVNHLKQIAGREGIKAEDAALQLIAQKSEGCMRDSLSILDKIVSFTNGVLNYENTIEHLNVLDEEYYFRLMTQMLEQDLAGAMLLFDEITRKGFEGDMVLNGFSEFIRNLLICKDERVLPLLEVVDAFKERYRKMAAQTDAAYLVSALHILNEAEVGYKSARNKRLHVELALIRLCYLGQALEVAADGGSLSKKKLTDSAKPLAFKTVPSFTPAVKTDNTPAKKPATEARLTIETPRPPAQEAKPDPAPVPEVIKPETPPAAPAPAKPKTSGNALTSLQAIRSMVGATNTGTAHNLPLELESLQKAWLAFIDELKKEKNPAWQGFAQATLAVVDDTSFEVTVDHNINQKFLEMERAKTCEFLQKHLKNRLLKFTINLVESAEPVMEETVHLSAKEQYLKMIETFPLVKELKDRLRLELDY